MDLQQQLDFALVMAECFSTTELLTATTRLLDGPGDQQDLPQEVRDRLVTLVRELQASITELHSVQAALDQLGPRLTPSFGIPLAVIRSRLNCFTNK